LPDREAIAAAVRAFQGRSLPDDEPVAQASHRLDRRGAVAELPPDGRWDLDLAVVSF
jgi:hypothetical protein